MCRVHGKTFDMEGSGLNGGPFGKNTVMRAGRQERREEEGERKQMIERIKGTNGVGKGNEGQGWGKQEKQIH